MFRIFNRLFSRNKKEKADSLAVSSAVNPEVVNILNEFKQKLDNIEKDISKMRVLIFELSNGKYNPFEEDNSLSPVDLHKTKETHDNQDNHGIHSSHSVEHNVPNSAVNVSDMSIKNLLSDGKEDTETPAELAEMLERNQEKLNQIHASLKEEHSAIRASDSKMDFSTNESDHRNAELNLENAEVALIQRFSSKRAVELDNYLSRVGQNNWSGKTDPFDFNKKKGGRNLQNDLLGDSKRGFL